MSVILRNIVLLPNDIHMVAWYMPKFFFSKNWVPFCLILFFPHGRLQQEIYLCLVRFFLNNYLIDRIVNRMHFCSHANVCICICMYALRDQFSVDSFRIRDLVLFQGRQVWSSRNYLLFCRRLLKNISFIFHHIRNADN